jgi:hypothetical protein
MRVARPGARVITRTGYALGATPTPADRRRAIDAALAAPFTQQGLKVEYTTYVGQSASPGLQRVAVSLVADLPVRRPGSGGTSNGDDSADVVFLVRDGTGRSVASGSERMALPATADDGFSTGASHWRVAFDLPAGDYIMRCIVREPGGVVGSADRRFKVRSLTGFDVTASDLLLSSPDDPLPVRARAYTRATLTGTARLYARSAEKLEQATGRVELLPAAIPESAPASARGVGVTFGPVVQTVSGAMRDVIFSLPLSELEAGPYVARAVVQVGGETVADLRRPVDVVIGDPPAVASEPAAERPPSDVLEGESGRRLIQRLAASARPNVRAAAALLDRREFAAALSAAPADPDAESARLRGLAQLGQQNYAGAAATLGAEFDAHPTDADVAFVLGWARRGAGDVPGALGAFRNAANLAPRLVPAHLAVASTYASVGQSALAIQALQAGLVHLPDSPELRDMLERLKK